MKFNVLSGTNRHTLTVSGGAYADGHGDLYLFSKSTRNADGSINKGEKLDIPFKDRFTSPKLKEVADFKKFVIDLEKPKRRYELQRVFESFNDGKEISQKELDDLGLKSCDEIEKALTESKNKRHEFVCEYDYIDFLRKLINSEKYKDKLFKITGEFVVNYNENSNKENKFYSYYKPTRIYLADDNAEEYSTMNITAYFNKDSLDISSLPEKNKAYINAYIFVYENNIKENIPYPISFTLCQGKTEIEKKQFEHYKKYFAISDDGWKEYGITLDIINGTEKKPLTYDMLDDEQKELIDLELATLEDIQKEEGGYVYGDIIREYRFNKYSRGYSKGSKPTVYTDEDFIIRDTLDDDIEDLFEDDEEL